MTSRRPAGRENAGVIRARAGAPLRGLAVALAAWLVLPVVATGCRTISVDTARRVASVASLGRPAVGTRAVCRASRAGPVAKLFSRPPAPSQRSRQLLRRYVLDDQYRMEPEMAIRRLKSQAMSEPGLERMHAVAELAWLQGEWSWRMGQSQRALRMYATALESSYRFLFDPALDLGRNAYDPQFRSISDIYNRSLESILRHLIQSGQLHPGQRVTLTTIDAELAFEIEAPGHWRDQQFARFELVNDFEVQGVQNQYHTFGLGVPLIAVRASANPQTGAPQDGLEANYPPGLTMAMTAFLRLDSRPSRDPYAANTAAEPAKLFLVDPLGQTSIRVGNRIVPLESDITTPLARYLNDPLLGTSALATLALINADFANQFEGLYMLEPFDPDKVPVVMIHGLWSSPVTWLQMFNDLRADPEIRRHYQFWFSLYPTGQPWWESARQVRAQLRKVRQRMGTDTSPGGPLDQMVLVGHSMGGLVGRMQTISSDQQFWQVISEHDPGEFTADGATIQWLRETFFFEPDPAVARLITIATPHAGSSYANDTTRWVGRKLITLPTALASGYMALATRNSQLIRDASPLTTATSIDSLSPENPFFAVLAGARTSPRVTCHNIYGNVPRSKLAEQFKIGEPGDGVVAVKSARFPRAESEIEINATHSAIHQHPRTVLEVKRILLEHLAQLGRTPDPAVVSGKKGMLEPQLDRAVVPAGWR